MPKTDRIQDDGFRRSMVEAQAALKAGEYKRVVELTSATYTELLRRKPEMTEGAAHFRNVMFFPRLGAHLQLNSQGEPEVTFDREKFIFSEAVTYYEYVMDSLVKNGS